MKQFFEDLCFDPLYGPVRSGIYAVGCIVFCLWLINRPWEKDENKQYNRDRFKKITKNKNSR